MKKTLIFSFLFMTLLFKGQTYNFSSVKKDTTVYKVNATVTLDKENKKIYVNWNSKILSSSLRIMTFYITRYSVADKYQLMDCRDSITNKPSYIEIFQGKKETYMSIEFDNKYLLK